MAVDVAAYAALTPRYNDPGLSRRELQRMWGLGDRAARERIQLLVDRGQLIAGRRRIQGRVTPVYRIPEAKT